VKILLGPPGTGKTTALLKIVEDAFAGGVRPDRVGYVAFTKKAATEALDRAKERFSLTEKDLPYFRTLHSLAFRSLGMRRSQMMGKPKIEEFGNIMGLRMTSTVNMDEGAVFGSEPGDIALFVVNLARIRKISLEDQWRETPNDIPWFEVERVSRGLEEFKKAEAIYDFTDLLENWVATASAPELDLLVVDESQDLSRLQWDMVMKLAERAKQVVIAGDDDQAVFRWAGADVDYFLGLEGDREVLGQSYRVPRKVQKVADDIIQRVTYRATKEWAPRDTDGEVNYHQSISTIDMSGGTWLVLARNNYLLGEAEEQCRREGLHYSRGGRPSVSARSLTAIKAWERLRKGSRADYREVGALLHYVRNNGADRPDRSNFDMADVKRIWGLLSEDIWHEAFERMPLVERLYLVAMLRRGEKITRDPRIKLSTIHSAKGGEADNVVLYTDMARRTYNGMRETPDDELRVFYVGVTRAKESLHIITPQTTHYFPYL
jgi:DNA helicase-2/ATP-dependent DNA helicase PcrA